MNEHVVEPFFCIASSLFVQTTNVSVLRSQRASSSTGLLASAFFDDWATENLSASHPGKCRRYDTLLYPSCARRSLWSYAAPMALLLAYGK